MVKNSTSSNFIEKTESDKSKGADLQKEFSDVHKVIETKQLKAPRKCVDFILNFSKAFKTKKLKNGDYAEMIIN